MKYLILGTVVALMYLLSVQVLFASEVTGTITTGLTAGETQGTVVVAPTASPSAGSFSSNQNVTLTATGSTSIHYTTDGTDPTCSTGTTYSGAIPVSSTTTIEAISCYPNSNASSVASFTYTISSGGGGGGSSPKPVVPAVPATPAVPAVPGLCPNGNTLASNCTTAPAIPAVPATPATPAYNFGTTVLKNGSVGEAVKELQRFLNATMNLGLVVDGMFGPLTSNVMKQWQIAHGLVADGLIGPLTKAAMLASVGATPATPAVPGVSPAVPATPATYNFGTEVLKNGSTGEAVKELQRFLNATLNLGLVVDGGLGPKTIAVIKQWQLAHGLVADGLVGPATKAAMLASLQ